MSLVENIKRLRKSHNTSIPKLEEEVGIGVHAIYKWDTSYPSVDRVLKVADYFGVTTDYLLGREQLSHEESEVKNKMPEPEQTKKSEPEVRTPIREELHDSEDDSEKLPLKRVYKALVSLVLEIADGKNYTGKNVEVLPALIDKIIILNSLVH